MVPLEVPGLASRRIATPPRQSVQAQWRSIGPRGDDHCPCSASGRAAGIMKQGRPSRHYRKLGVVMNGNTYPVRVDGELDPAVSRWLWLVKWLLLIPHFIILFFLWFAAAVLTLVAGIAILITGRYPHAIFDFNVGVMRWTWRVGFYGIASFGTDKYPPFSLNSDPSYPADFHVDYPDRLSRGLVLIKWWLLAIPQYLIVAIFAGGWDYGRHAATWATGGGGLIALLALIAAIALLFSGRYPQQLFDFVMGLNRWCYRVFAYVALMRDEYPPFRLDTGGRDPGDVPAMPAGPGGPSTPWVATDVGG
jgi:hypothetical protein